MSNKIKPGLIATLPDYCRLRSREYKLLHESWLSGATQHVYPTDAWPADQCLLTQLPTELLVLICDYLYQADLFHLSCTTRALADYPTHLLYTRDITHFGCLALRWACTFGTIATLERALSYGAPVDDVFLPDSSLECGWVIGGIDLDWICDTPLKTAILASEPEIIRRLIAHGANVNALDIKSTSRRWELLFPINLALGAPDIEIDGVQFGDPLIVRCLLDAGADPNQYTRPGHPLWRTPRVLGVTPLLMAMQAQVPIETVKLLLERGADPTLIGSYEGFLFSRFRESVNGFWDRSPLTASLFCSVVTDAWLIDLEKIRLLLAYGAGHELAHFCCANIPYLQPVIYRYWNNLKIVSVLNTFIAARVDVAGWAARGISPILSVIWWAERFIPLSWRKGALQKIPNAISKTCEVIEALAEATLVRHTGALTRKSAIIDAVVPPSMCLPEHKKDQTALRYVCGPFRFMGATTLAPLLLHYGADINSADEAGRTALHHATMFTSGERVRMLVKFIGPPASSGLNINARDARGWTPLHYACLYGFWDDATGQFRTARLLLDHGADVRARTIRGWTPLSLAVLSANMYMVQLLLERGAGQHDLLIPPSAGESQAEPMTVPIGRFILRQSNSWQPMTMSGIKPEFRAAKMRISKLLESRIGVSIPVTVPDEDEDEDQDEDENEDGATDIIGPPRSFPFVFQRVKNVDSAGSPSPFQINELRRPFGLGGLAFENLTTRNFEDGINGILLILDYNALKAWVVTVSHPSSVHISWRPRLASDEHGQQP